VRDWFRTLDGQGKKCSMFFTYGGWRAVGDRPDEHDLKMAKDLLVKRVVCVRFVRNYAPLKPWMLNRARLIRKNALPV